MILLIDNYDSFTYNLYHVLVSCGVDVEVIRNDACSVKDIAAKQPRGIVISPGPGRPEQTGVCLALIAHLHHSPIPLLGVCLGHQTIAQYFGAKIIHAPSIMHGKTSTIKHHHHGMFAGIEEHFTATRYHSLVVDRTCLPSCLKATAYSLDDAQVMAFHHCTFPFWGVQFHPESIASSYGPRFVENFLREHLLLS